MSNKKILITIIALSLLTVSTLIICMFYSAYKEKNCDDRNTTVNVNSEYKELEANIKVYRSYTEFDTDYPNFKQNYISKFSDTYNATEFDNNYHYEYITFPIGGCSQAVENVTTKVEGTTLNVYFDIASTCGVCAPEEYHYLKKVDNSITETKTYSRVVSKENCRSDISYKPMIYIYPDKNMDLTVTLGNTDALTHTYPKYNNSWNVHVSKDGNIFDYNTKRNYYALYWEAYDSYIPNMTEGFVVKGKDTIKLLEDKLKLLGLNDKEINEFIVYWIDKVENNKYNYIYFRTTEEVNKSMPLEFSKNPDTLIRILVDFVPLDEYIEVKEQTLTPQTRAGYSVIEWGGNIHSK